MKHGELLANHYGDYLVCLLATGFNKGRWAGDRIEIIGEETMAATSKDGQSDGSSLYEQCYDYKDITEEIEINYKDWVEDAA